MQETEEISGLKYESSVFSNPFRAKEDRKEAILSKHVGVTMKQEAGTMFNGKKVSLKMVKHNKTDRVLVRVGGGY